MAKSLDNKHWTNLADTYFQQWIENGCCYDDDNNDIDCNHTIICQENISV